MHPSPILPSISQQGPKPPDGLKTASAVHGYPWSSMVIHGRPPWSTALAALSGFAAAGVRDPPPALRCGAWEGVENQMHIWSRKK